LADLHDWIKVINSVPSSPKTKLLVEAKLDLEDQREINKEDAEKIHYKYNFKGDIIGTSSKTGENVEKVFEMLGREILKSSLKKCSNCGRLYPLELKFCQHCGNRTL